MFYKNQRCQQGKDAKWPWNLETVVLVFWSIKTLTGPRTGPPTNAQISTWPDDQFRSELPQSWYLQFSCAYCLNVSYFSSKRAFTGAWTVKKIPQIKAKIPKMKAKIICERTKVLAEVRTAVLVLIPGSFDRLRSKTEHPLAMTD